MKLTFFISTHLSSLPVILMSFALFIPRFNVTLYARSLLSVVRGMVMTTERAALPCRPLSTNAFKETHGQAGGGGAGGVAIPTPSLAFLVDTRLDGKAGTLNTKSPCD